VHLTGDTIRGEINYQDWHKDPLEISFRKSPTAAVQQFDPSTCRYFEITGTEIYQRYEGRISLNKTDLKDLTTSRDTTTRKAIVFLKVMRVGPNVSLFSYTDALKTRYFVQEQPAGTPQELQYYVFYNSQHLTEVVTQRPYQRQLWLMAVKYNQATTQLKYKLEAKDRQTALIETVNAINGFNGKEALVKMKLKKKPGIRFLVGAGLNQSVVGANGDTDLARQPVATASYRPAVALGADIFTNRMNPRLFFRAELSFSSSSPQLSARMPDGAGYRNTDLAFSQFSGSFISQVNYHVYNGQKLKAYLGAGLGLTAAHYTQNQYRSSYVNPQGEAPADFQQEFNFNFRQFWSTPAFRVGASWGKKLDGAVLYLPPKIIGNNTTGSAASYNFNLSSWRIQFNYLFGGLAKSNQ